MSHARSAAVLAVASPRCGVGWTERPHPSQCGTPGLTPPAPRPPPHPADSPLFRTFLTNITAKGFFAGAEEGTPAYQERLGRALAKFKERNAAAPSPAPAAAAPAPSPADEAAAEAAKEEGNAHFKAGRWQRAIEAYTDAIERAPASPSAHLFWNNRAAAKISAKDYAGAAEDARAAVEREPGFVKGHVRLGTALQYAGRCVQLGGAGRCGLGRVGAGRWRRRPLE